MIKMASSQSGVNDDDNAPITTETKLLSKFVSFLEMSTKEQRTALISASKINFLSALMK